MKDWLKPGTEVVCVGHIKATVWSGEILPMVHGVYTVREVVTAKDLRGVEHLGIRLVEIVNEPRQYVDAFTEAVWQADAFRPLTKRSTDAEVSKLKRLLNTTPADLEKVDG